MFVLALLYRMPAQRKSLAILDQNGLHRFFIAQGNDDESSESMTVCY